MIGLFDAPGELNAMLELFFGTQSIFGLSGEYHRHMRQLMMPPFHGERMGSYGQLICEITDAITRDRVAGRHVRFSRESSGHREYARRSPSMFASRLN